MYLADCHTHTRISPDSEAALSDMADAALAAGLSGLWVTDHFDLLNTDGQAVCKFDWDAALAQFDAAASALTGPLELRLGLELGSAPFDPAAARSVLSGAGERLDFVLGSLHNWIGARGNRDFYFTRFTGDAELCRAAMDNDLDSTWALVTECDDCYDSLAHVDYPLRYITRDGHDLSVLDYEQRLRAIFTEVARTDHALELNTCRGRGLGPWPELLRWFRECGGKYVTVGSDAHRPSDVAKGVREGAALVEQAGLRLTVYRNRKPENVS